MKILMIVPFLPNTSMSGGQTRWYNLIKYMSADHQITLFSLIKDESERKFISELEKYCQKVLVFKRPKSPWTVRNILLTAFSPYPLLVVRNWSPQVRWAIRQELESEKYDLIHAETFYVMPHIPKAKIPSIMVEQTIEYQVYQHFVENEVFPLFRPFLMVDVMKLRFWEVHFWKKATRLVAVSEEDKKHMLKLIPGTKIDVIPNGVDAAYYAAKKVEKKIPPRVMYGVTNFEWLQNAEAVKVLYQEIWPRVKKQIAEVKLWIVGRKIPGWLKEAAEKDPEIEITENIKDARDGYGGATVMTAPIRGSGGTRLKILEAMAASLPIVSTSIGVAGLNLVPGKHALISDTSKGLAQETVRLLKNPKLARKIGQAGREFVEEHFDWKAIVKLHDPIYQEITQKERKEN